MITVNFYQVNSLQETVKALAWSTAPAITMQAVHNGLDGNFAFHVPNFVDVSTPIGNLATYDYIGVQSGSFEQVNTIEQLLYINDNCTRVFFQPDYFMTVIKGGHYNSGGGLCARSHITTQNPFSPINNIPEPIGGNNYRRASGGQTGALNTALVAWHGCDWGSVMTGSGNASPEQAGYVIVVTISALLWEFLGRPNAFTQDIVPSAELKTVTSLPRTIGQNIYHSGGLYTGFPIVFSTMNNLNIFMENLFQDPSGYQVEVDVEVGSVKVGSDDFGSYAWSDHYGQEMRTITRQNIYDTIYEQETKSTLLISQSDIINAQFIPEAFANPSLQIFSTHFSSNPENMSNVNGLRNENPDYGKLFSNQFRNFELVTARGDILPLDPIGYARRSQAWAWDGATFDFIARYIGGDNARIEITCLSANGWTASTSDVTVSSTRSAEWAVIRQMPQLSLSFDGNITGQQQWAIQNAQSISASTAHTMQNSNGGFISAISQGARGNRELPAGAGTLARWGNAIGSWANNLTGGAIERNATQQWVTHQRQAEQVAQAGNVNPSQQRIISSSDPFSDLWKQDVIWFTTSLTNSENWAVGQMFDRQGQSVSGVFDPITSPVSTLFGGQATTRMNDGRYFFKFHDFDCNVSLPVEYRESINSFFLNGGWLLPTT